MLAQFMLAHEYSCTNRLRQQLRLPTELLARHEVLQSRGRGSTTPTLVHDENEDPRLFEIVKKNMIKGPSRIFNPKFPCMKEGKNFLKIFRRLMFQGKSDSLDT